MNEIHSRKLRPEGDQPPSPADVMATAERIAAQGDEPLMRPITLPRPAWALIEINNDCNLNCAMCRTQLSRRRRGHMTPETFERIIDQLQALGVAHPGMHTVGEPFLHPDLPGLMEIAQARRYPVYLSTNAQFPRALAQLIDRFSDAIHKIRFSIDAATAETYGQIRRGGRFDRVISSLEAIKEFNHRAARPVALRAGFVISQTNVHEVGPFLEMLEPYTTPDHVRFFLIDGLSPSHDYFHETFPFPRLVRPNAPCRLVFKNVHFTYDAQATLCCRDYDAQVVIGRVESESVPGLWRNQRAEDIRAMHRGERQMSIPACAQCFVPYRFVNRLADLYVHWLYDQGRDPDRIGERLWAFLADLNRGIDDGEARRRTVRAWFEAV
jgi:pyruvate-formate lyase-activating enzyme